MTGESSLGEHSPHDVPRPAHPDEAGIAILAVLILGTAVALLAHAGLMMGMALERAASADARTVETDARLYSRIRQVATSIDGLDAILPVDLTAARLTPELLRVRADSAGRAAVGMVWAMDTETRLDQLRATILTGVPVSEADRIRITALTPDSCPGDLTAPASLPDVSAVDWTDRVPLDLGPLGRDAWESLPSPPGAGSAEIGAWWAPESVVLETGSWTGLLAVGGSLHVGAGAEIAGWVAVSGDLVVHVGGRVTGVIRTGGSVRIEEGATVRAAPCLAVTRLGALPNLTSPRLLEPGPWPADRTF